MGGINFRFLPSHSGKSGALSPDSGHYLEFLALRGWGTKAGLRPGSKEGGSLTLRLM